MKNVIISLLLVAGLLGSAMSAEAAGAPKKVQATPGTFEAGKGTFLLNGEPFVVKAAEVHYPRIPRPYWEHRIQMCKALGMNTLCLYVFWNIHEQQEGVFDFTENNDLRAFIQLAQKNGMYIILRPGPYVCAEWEMGGLPWWLLKKKDIRLRELDPYFMERLKIFESKVAEQVADLTIDKGGPIIMVQVENEYGSYGVDKPYVSAVRDALREVGFDKVQLFQCDWSSNFTNNGLDDLIWTMNFGTGANIDNEFRRLGELRPDAPKMCSEFWSGWFDKWGGKHETRGAKDMVEGLDEMLSKGISFSLYMTHGGTNWGHWAGANSPGFAPDVTSYDYDAPINEAGQATPKYYELRTMMAKYMNGEKQAKVPAAIPTIAIPKIQFTEVAPIFDNLPAPKITSGLKTMEEFDQGWGSIIYRYIFDQDIPASVLRVTEPHDYAQIFVNGVKVGALDRREHEKEMKMPAVKKGDRLDIFVEAMGRINFGRAIKDFKGITEKVEFIYQIGAEQSATVTVEPKLWTVYNINDDYETVKAMNWQSLVKAEQYPAAAYRATFKLKKVGDTFINLETWGKGQLYVNGHPMGRFWQIGPQQTLYMPGCWLKKGENEIIVVDIVGPDDPVAEGLKEPIIDRLNLKGPQTHRKQGENLDLSGEKPVKEGSFAAGNGWQEVRFDQPVSGRYVCIEALNVHDAKAAEGKVAKGIACIAEWYMLDEQGKRLSREPWQADYADDENITDGNQTADKIFDLQESTYWSTNRKSAFPHQLIIDLGKDYTFGGFQYLPRAEAGAPGSICDYRIYVKSGAFKK